MQKQYEAIVAQNKSLQSELRLANKMIEFLSNQIRIINVHKFGIKIDKSEIIKIAKNKCIKELGE